MFDSAGLRPTWRNAWVWAGIPAGTTNKLKNYNITSSELRKTNVRKVKLHCFVKNILFFVMFSVFLF
jgi:hypothetical protein